MDDAVPVRWRRVRRIVAHPFARTANAARMALVPCAFRLGPEQDFNTEERNYTISPETPADDVAPLFKLDVDWQCFDEIKVSTSEVQLAIAVKDHFNKKYIREASWVTSDVPEEFEIGRTTVNELAIAGDVEFSIIVALCEAGVRRPG